MATHVGSVAPTASGISKGGDADASHRLEQFRWELVREEWNPEGLLANTVRYWREQDRNPRQVAWLIAAMRNGRGAGSVWVEVKRKPVSCAAGVNHDGLQEAAEHVATDVQTELHRRRPKLDDRTTAGVLGARRALYLSAFMYLGGTRIALEREAAASPDGLGRAICRGGSDSVLGAYGGCLGIFDEKPFGRGRHWPTWCPTCRRLRKKNELDKARRRQKNHFSYPIASGWPETPGTVLMLTDKLTINGVDVSHLVPTMSVGGSS